MREGTAMGVKGSVLNEGELDALDGELYQRRRRAEVIRMIG
jgi:hypothetical protein